MSREHESVVAQRRENAVKMLGPLEVVRSPPWETWRLTWHRPSDAKRGMWLYRWAICTPWITLRWVSAEYRAMFTKETR